MKRLLLLVIFLLAASASAQEFRATISGRVTDSTGAIIPKANVVVRNTDTGVIANSTSNASGEFTVPFLLPGKYSITVSADGFQKSVHDGINLKTGDKLDADTILTIGSVNQEVHVTADTPLIETNTATSGQVLSAEEVEDLPDNGRSPLGLAKSMYGVVAKQKNSVVQARPFDNSAASDYSLGGGNSQSNEYLLNGVPNMQDSSRLPGFSPLQDSVQEVRVDLFESDASVGDTSGGTVNLVTKGGTNTFHGALSEFNQFSAINAPTRWFSNGSKQLATRQNQYGGYIGGPIWIPKIFNGRDKLFFLYSYEGFKGSTPNPQTTTVPTAAERTGDFSALLALGTQVTGTRCTVGGTKYTTAYNSYQLFDPASGAVDPNCPGQALRTPLTNNIIPQGRLNSIALAYLKYYPLPNQPGAADGENNFFSNVPTTNNYTSQSGRLDYSINEKNKLFFETHRSEYIQTSSNIFQNISTGARTYTVYQGGLLDYVHTFTPTATVDARISLTRSYKNSSLPSQGFQASTLGFPTYLNQNPSTALPRLAFTESGTTFAGLSTQPGALAAFDTIQFFSAFTKVRGHHTFKIGPDLRQNKNNVYSPGYSSGTFGFDKTFVGAGTTVAGPLYGGSFASFLFGNPVSGTYNIAPPLTYNNWYYGAFIQDDWRVNQHLSMNLGFRAETETGINESRDRAIVGFDPTVVNSATAGAVSAYAKSPVAELPTSSFTPTGGVVYASASNRSEYKTPTAYVSPRLGFSYAPPIFNDKFVFRGGFGIYVNPFNDYYTPQTYGFSSTTTLVPSNNSNLSPASTLNDPFPTTNAIIQPTGSSLGVNQNLGSSITFRPKNVQVPYSERWDADIQLQLSKNTMINVGYIGNHQVHLSYSNCISCTSQLPFLSRSPTNDPTVQANLSAAVANPFKGQPGVTGTLATASTITKLTLLGQFPEYSSVTEQLVPGQSATYNALLFRLYIRSSHGLTTNVNYTYSHNLATAQLNQGGPLTYQENASDFPNHLSITNVYKLPFGHQKTFLAHAPRIVDELVGGFTVNTIYQYLSGAALSWGLPYFANGTAYDPNLKVSPRQFFGAFDKTLFNTVSTAQPSSTYNYRTFPLFYGRQDATNNLDASILKDFYAGERFKIQYRFEAFNVLNHTSFGAPNTSPTSATFGTITSVSSVPRVLQQGLRVTF